MSKLKPRTKPPAARRDELMNAAQRLFLEHGVEATTIEQITAGADVAKGTFYLHFSSKEDILAALRGRYAQDLLASIKAAIAENAEDDWKGKLAAWARTIVAGYLHSIRLHDVVFFECRPPTRDGLFNPISDDEARQQQIAWGAPGPLVEARLSIFRAIREGRLESVTDTVERVLGRRPLTFDRWAHENAAEFR